MSWRLGKHSCRSKSDGKGVNSAVEPAPNPSQRVLSAGRQHAKRPRMKMPNT